MTLRFLAFVLLHVLPTSLLAQSAEDYLSFTAPKPWVEELELVTSPFQLGDDRPVHYLISDAQVFRSADESHSYYRTALKLLTPSAVEENSTLTIEFDPQFETVDFHYLTRIRDGKKEDILDPSRFDAFRIETDRDRLIYNGTLLLSYVVNDVRPGDVLDYAYTVTGRNPALGTNYSGAFLLAFSVPVKQLQTRLIIDDSTAFDFQDFLTDSEPNVTSSEFGTEYTWRETDIPARLVDSNTPAGSVDFPAVFYSSYDSWADVGRHFAPYYDVTQFDLANVRKLADDIRTQHADTKSQVRAALDFVQKEIRYLGIELGSGGYIPRAPDTVLQNRFGDCKDMTVLLISILHELGIDANPLLVSSTDLGEVAKFKPSHATFDHVIVVTEVDGEAYYLDATRGVQLGTLDTLQQAGFDAGVIIDETSADLVTYAIPNPDYFHEFVDTYDVLNDDGTVTLTSQSNYFGGVADSILDWYEYEGSAQADRSYLSFYQNFYPSAEQVKPLALDVDHEAAKITLTGVYRIPGAWQLSDDGFVQTFSAHAFDVLNEVPEFTGVQRTLPFNWPHPVRSKQTLNFLLDETWDIETTSTSFDTPVFDFSSHETNVDHVYSMEVSYISKASSLAAEDFADTMAIIDELSDHIGITLTKSDFDNAPLISLDNPLDRQFLFVFVGLIGALIAFIVAMVRDKEEEVRFENQLFRPVSVPKFIVMCIVTAGLYPSFWAYQNWRWLKVTERKPNLSFIRALFHPFTNFGLFKWIANEQSPPTAPRKLFTTIAVLILLMSFFSSSATGQEPGIYTVVILLLCAAWLPVVSHVRQLNENNPGIIKHNSRFGWETPVLAIVFIPSWYVHFLQV